MKKFVYFLSAAVIVAGCQTTQVEVPESASGETFKFEALLPDTDTKTTFTAPYTVAWEDTDALAVFLQQSNNTPIKFTKSSTTNMFESGTSVGKGYTHVYYPYDENMTMGVNTTSWTNTTSTSIIGSEVNASQNQEGIGAEGSVLKHIKAPLVGWFNTSETTSVEMKHITTLLDVKLTNNTNSPITVTNVTVTTSQNLPLIGKFYLSAYNKNVVATDNSSEQSTEATLAVTSGEIAANKTGHFYLITAPFTVTTGGTLTATITTDRGTTYTKTVNVYLPLTIAAGKVNHISLTTDSTSQSSDYGEKPAASQITFSTLYSPYTHSNDGGGIDALINDPEKNFWHSIYTYGTDNLNTVYGHYIDITLPEALNVLQFQYQTRINNNNGVPEIIVIGGSNDENAVMTSSSVASSWSDNSKWTILKTYTKDDSSLATGQNEWCNLSVITTQIAYKYIRFGIAKSALGDLRTQHLGTSLSQLNLFGQNTTASVKTE